jgi:hypothetical protein
MRSSFLPIGNRAVAVLLFHFTGPNRRHVERAGKFVPAGLALHLLWPALCLFAGDRDRPFLLFGGDSQKAKKEKLTWKRKRLRIMT